MRSIWSCSSCVALLLGAVLPRGARAAQLEKQEMVHRVEKVYVTTQLLGRRDDVCPSVGLTLCPASVGGGCCPDGYGCDTSSCVSTKAATASACGLVGYTACPIDAGAGCCPQGYDCQRDGCFVPDGSTMTYSQNCPVGYYLCPSSLSYGCCQNGMGCAPNACYATTPVTYIFTQTFTTTTEGNALTTTITTSKVTTPTMPTTLPQSDTTAAWPKLVPTSIAKVSATSAPSSSSGGLTTPQLGGIIGGAIGLLIIVLVATFIIIKKLHRTQKVMEASQKGSSSEARNSRQSKPMTQYKPTSSQVDQMEYDDLLQPRNGVDTPPTGGRARSASGYSSSNQTPFPSSSSEARHPSMDSAGYFADVAAHISRSQNLPGRHSMSTDRGRDTSVDSSTPGFQHWQYANHGRNHSNASQLSDGASSDGIGGGVGSPLIPPVELGTEGAFIPELPGSPYEQARRRSSSGAVPPSQSRPPLAHARRRSDGHARDRSGSSATACQGQGQMLDVVNESVEHLHGYYGPRNYAVGQTGAGADLQTDISSPVAPGYQGQPNSQRM